jgi:uncharacterized surface protein with fasciclin (FAS1) repeats
MTSAHGYFESWDYKYLYDKHPKRGFVQEPKYKPDTIMGYLISVPSFSLFCYMIKLSGMDGILDSPHTECTLLVVPDSELNEQEVLLFDKYEARKIVQYHFIPKKVSMNTISSRKLTKVDTRQDGSCLFFNTLSGSILINDQANILVPDVLKSNGYINVISSMVTPD